MRPVSQPVGIMRAVLLVFGLACFTPCICLSELKRDGRDDLKEFEGRYEYFNRMSVQFAQSPKDGLLYAIIDEAFYPLKTADRGVFLDRQGSRIVFERESTGEVAGYRFYQEKSTNFFKRISTGNLPKEVWYARVPSGNGPFEYEYSSPKDLNDGLEVGSLRDASMNSASIKEMVEQIARETHKNIHSVLIARNGKFVLEEYFYQYDRDKLHQLRSATKSIVSALVGIALDKKLIKSKEEMVLSFFPEYELKNLSPEKRAITIEHLLMNASGLDCNDSDQSSPGNEVKMGTSPDWVKFILDLPSVEPPGQTGRYCSGGVILLGRIVEKASNQKLPTFASENLFGKLNISTFKWNFSPDNSSSEDFCQLQFRPRDMMKIGLLYLNEGRWHGEQVISPEWVKASLSKHSRVNGTDYGYLWWRQWLNVNGTRVDGVTAKGNGGQRIYLWPDHNMVVVITAGSYNEPSAADELQIKYILPAVRK